MKFEKGFFVVTGSKLLRLGEPYRVSVFCYGYKKEEELLMRIVSSNKQTNKPDFKKVSLSGENVQIVDIEVS